ncbi:8854_t:CDS:1, partial [Cetraspora pellucida]
KRELQKNEIEFLDLNAKLVESDFSNLQILNSDSAENLQQTPISIDSNNEIIKDKNDIITFLNFEKKTC